jgi:hypothetical protein
MRADLLNLLADYLENLPPEAPEFDMGSWGSHHACGTSACAIGHAALMPEFQALGLRMRGVDAKVRIFELLTVEEFNSFLEKNPHAEAHIEFNGRGDGFTAAADLFDIDINSAEHLFDCSADTAKKVAENIRQYIEENSDEG